MKRTAIIMAGGSGERFWPLSRRNKPKQLLNLLCGDKTMLEESIERISQLIPKEDIYIITSSQLLEPIRAAMPDFPCENVVAEPFKRNTAPCLALGAAFILAKYTGKGFEPADISISVLTADQDIKPVAGFLDTVRFALEFVEQNPALATIGIAPSRPETGYGYIEVESQFDSAAAAAEIKPVVRFLEKPEIETAKIFAASGRHLWNSGMFFWRLDTFIEKMTACLPEVGGQIAAMAEKYHNKTHIIHSEALHTLSPIFEAMPNISIDYGLMEKADNVVVAKALFEWDDVGSWDSLDRTRPKDAASNVNSGACIAIDTRDSILINESGGKIILSVLGMESIVAVVTGDAVMICPKDRVQEIKKCVESLRNSHGNQWL